MQLKYGRISESWKQGASKNKIVKYLLNQPNQTRKKDQAEMPLLEIEEFEK